MGAKHSTKSMSREDKLFTKYEKRLSDIEAIDMNEIDLEEIEEICDTLEVEMNALDGKKASKLSEVAQSLIRKRYLTVIQRRRKVVSEVHSLNELFLELTKMNAPINKGDETTFERKITAARAQWKELKSNKYIKSHLKLRLIQRIKKEFKRLDKEVTNQFLNVEVRDSIDLIEKTLEEPHLYTLPHLIMWRKTAEKKIEKMKNFTKPISQEIVTETIEKYESLIKQLRAEILKLRTYPIPEPWCSFCMREGVTHMIKGEFIFFVHPGIMEDMRPLNLSDRDILPGGLTRQEYSSRMNRLSTELTIAKGKLEMKTASDIEEKLKWCEDSFVGIEFNINFVFTELPLLYRDGRTLEYLVNKNQDDDLLKEIYDIILRAIRHYFNNRVNIPSVAVDSFNRVMLVAPPKAERNIPIASGIDRGATEMYELVTPASVALYKNNAIVADKYGHLISYYRDSDFEALGWNHRTTADTPVSLTVFNDTLYVCYTNELVQFNFSWGEGACLAGIHFNTSITIPQVCCTAFNDNELFVGTLKPSIILIDTETLQIYQEYSLNPIRYETKNNRYPWLQDIKVIEEFVLCLFTGSPSPLQAFSFTGELIKSILTEDKIVGAYHFNLFWNPATEDWRIYTTDFWDNAIKVFDLNGQFIETFSEKGLGLGQIFHPTGIFIEESGFITVCDMKEDNCLQRF